MDFLSLTTALSQFAAGCTQKSSPFQLPPWYAYLQTEEIEGRCAVKINELNDIALIAVAVVEILIRLTAIVAVGYVIYGGIKMSMSSGDPEKFKGGRNTVQNALIGMVISIVAIGIVAFIGNQLGD